MPPVSTGLGWPLSTWLRRCAGEVVLHAWVEWLKAQEHLWAAPPTCPEPRAAQAARQDDQGEYGAGAEETAAAAPAAPVHMPCAESARVSAAAACTVHGEPFVERKSTFQVRESAHPPPSGGPVLHTHAGGGLQGTAPARTLLQCQAVRCCVWAAPWVTTRSPGAEGELARDRRTWRR